MVNLLWNDIFLREIWSPIKFIFEWLCLSQIITALNACNNFVHDDRGNPKYFFYFNLSFAISISIAFYFAAKHGLNGLLLSCFTVYLLISSIWIGFILRQLNIEISEYFSMLFDPLKEIFTMAAGIYFIQVSISKIPDIQGYLTIILLFKMLTSIVTNTGYLWLFDRNVFIT